MPDEPSATAAVSAEPTAPRRPGEPDPLSAFPTEAQVARRATFARWRIAAWVGLVALAGGIALGAAMVIVPGATVGFRRLVGLRATPGNAVLVVRTTPGGWTVTEKGRTLGVTPLTVALEPGSHDLVLQKGDVISPLTVSLAAGTETVHHLDLPEPSRAGRLQISTSPAGAAVDVDGVRRGVSPLAVVDLAPGEHTVTVTSGDRAVTQRMTVTGGLDASLIVPLGQPPAQAPAAGVGWVAISAAIELQVFEGDSLIGSSRNPRIMLMPGRHVLRLANTALGFDTSSTVTVEPGALARIAPTIPTGTLSVNAVPWAEVVLDGVVIGETPIANYAAALGSHELVLRNPKFPDQRRTVVVSLASTARVGVDFRQ